MKKEIESDFSNVNLRNPELVDNQIYCKYYQLCLLFEIFIENTSKEIESISNEIIFRLQILLNGIFLENDQYPYNLIHDCIMNRVLFKTLYIEKKYKAQLKLNMNF